VKYANIAKAFAEKEFCGNTIGMDVLQKNDTMRLINAIGDVGNVVKAKRKQRPKTIRRKQVGSLALATGVGQKI